MCGSREDTQFIINSSELFEIPRGEKVSLEFSRDIVGEVLPVSNFQDSKAEHF